jgi:hypothetical protein
MAGRTSQPQVRYPDPLPPPPERSDAQTQELAAEQRAALFRRGGRASTILTGGQGVDGGSTAARFLGSAART